MNKLLLCIISCFGLVFQAEAMLFKAEEFTLDNGLKCVVVENHKAPIVKHMVWYKTGAVYEQAGKGGLAHLLEHLMFRGTSRLEDGKLNKILENNGVVSNAFTSYNVTAYHQLTDVSRLEAVMALEADRMENLNFNQEAFEAERKIVFQERMQVVENNPASPFRERLQAMQWGNSPYARPVTGQNAEILGLSYDDAMDFYQRYYAPNNAILILSGDIDVKTARKLAIKYYGNIKPKELVTPNISGVADKFEQTLKMRVSGINAPRLSISYMLPSAQELADKIYAFIVLDAYLGSGETSVLYRDMVINKRQMLSVSTNYEFWYKTNSVFSFTMLPYSNTEDEGFAQLEKAVSAAMQNFDAEKLAQTKRKIIADLVYVNDNPADAAYWIGEMMTSGFELNEIQQYEDKINGVSWQDVNEAFNMLKSAAVTKGIMLPATENNGGSND